MPEKTKNIPYHIGFIADGNRRWARAKGLPILEGHRRGYDKLKKIGRWCKNRGVKVVTFWVFSTENWNRSKKEVDYLMKLLKRALNSKEVNQIKKEGIKIRVIGRMEDLAKPLQGAIKKAEEDTKNNKEGTIVFAINYGGRAEIIEGIKKIIRRKIPAEEITEKLVSQNLWTADLPYPDLIIRTSGEQRLSGFLMWNGDYSELYFCKKHWPDFSEKDLDETLEDYSRRQRRFGK